MSPCECGHTAAEHMPHDRPNRMCKHDECTCGSYTSVQRDPDTGTQKTQQEGHQAELEGKVAVSGHKETSADKNARLKTDAIKRDEKISACFERARKNL